MADRYGVFLHNPDQSTRAEILGRLGTRWYLDGTTSLDTIPTGHKKLMTDFAMGLTPAQAAGIALQARGSVWYLGGEPNAHGPPPNEAARKWHDLYIAIKSVDPTAVIASPSVLNWDFTCVGCGGYESGHSYMDRFRAEYKKAYGSEPPHDLWAIDLYPIDWVNLPSTHAQIVIDQIIGLRQYSDAIPEHVGKPIWITEFALLWGWSEFRVEKGLWQPAGSYETAKIIAYLGTVFDWLEINANAMKIDRWFQFITYANLLDPGPWAYSGISLFENPDRGAPLTAAGTYFRDRVVAAQAKPW